MDFSGDLYGAEIMVSFYERIRDEKRFSSIDDLIHQIAEDKKTVEHIFDKTVPYCKKLTGYPCPPVHIKQSIIAYFYIIRFIPVGKIDVCFLCNCRGEA